MSNKTTNPEHLRPLNAKELSTGLVMSGAIHYLIREMDKLQHTSMFKHKIKLTGKSFLTELEKHAAEHVWSETPEGGDIDKSVDQMEEMADRVHNWLMLEIAMSNLPAGQVELFWQDLQMTFKRHKMPLRIDQYGEIEFTSL